MLIITHVCIIYIIKSTSTSKVLLNDEEKSLATETQQNVNRPHNFWCIEGELEHCTQPMLVVAV